MMAQLKKVLSFRVILLITINSIIGSGMFFLPGIGAKYAGPASAVSWLILSIVAIYTAMCFSELVGMFPTSGGIYEFSKQAYGRFWSFMIGWIAWLVGNITTAMLIVGAIQYLLPYQTTTFTIAKIGVCLLWVLIFNIMAYRGMKTSAFMLVTFAIITLSVVFMLIIPSLVNMDIGNLIPFFIHETPFKNLTFIFMTVFFISEAFFGLESVTFLAGETKNPEKVLPKVLIMATAIIAVLTMALVITSLGAVHWSMFGGINEITDPTEMKYFGTHVTAPFAYLAYKTLGPLAMNIIVIGTYLVIIGAAAGWVVTGPRLILSLAEDKLFPSQFSRIHKTYHTPSKAIIFQGIATAVFVITSFYGRGYEMLLGLLIPLVLIMMSAVILTVPIMRKTHKITARPYKVPLPYVGPVLLILFNIFLTTMWIVEEKAEAVQLLGMGFSLVLIGVPIYLLIEMYYDPKMIVRVNDLLAHLALLTERIQLPMKVRKEIIELLGHLEGKSILEYGCSVGTLTLLLADEVTPYGKIYATDISEKDARITQRRINQMGHSHVKVIHDTEHNRVHPDVPKIDVVVSVGMVGYLQDVKKVLKELNQRLKNGSKVVFLDYDKFFYIIPNIEWLSDNTHIKKLFHECGFSVEVVRKQGILWQYIYIHGNKERNV